MQLTAARRGAKVDAPTNSAAAAAAAAVLRRTADVFRRRE